MMSAALHVHGKTMAIRLTAAGVGDRGRGRGEEITDGYEQPGDQRGSDSLAAVQNGGQDRYQSYLTRSSAGRSDHDQQSADPRQSETADGKQDGAADADAQVGNESRQVQPVERPGHQRIAERGAKTTPGQGSLWRISASHSEYERERRIEQPWMQRRCDHRGKEEEPSVMGRGIAGC